MAKWLSLEICALRFLGMSRRLVIISFIIIILV